MFPRKIRLSASYLDHPVEKYSSCNLEPKMWIIFVWQCFQIWEAKIRHFQHGFSGLRLILVHKVGKWLQSFRTGVRTHRISRIIVAILAEEEEQR